MMETYTPIDGETWKPVVGYEGIYEVSSLGRIRSLDKVVPSARSRSGKRMRRGRILQTRISNTGRERITLWKDGQMKTINIHRLVAAAFLGPSNLTVNHKDENPLNNRIENLEYMTVRDNVRYSACRPVESYDLNTGNTVKQYPSGIDTEVDGFNVGAVLHCCHHDKGYHTHKGYGWRFAS